MNDLLNDPEEGPEVRPARFSERLVAFMLDGLLFYGLFLLSLKLLNPRVPVLVNPRGQAVLSVWLVLFMLYHAGFASAGRPTIGKELMGLRVVDLEGLPLPFPRSLARALGYLLSTFFNIGFLWALINSEGRAWHDLLAGSQVVTVKERPRALVTAGAGACLAFLFGAFLWQNYGAPRFYRMETLAYARTTLRTLGRLEEVYRRQNGHYTDDVDRLARLTPDPDGYLTALSMSFDADKGIRIQVVPGGRQWTMMAYARDAKGTRLTINGPEQG